MLKKTVLSTLFLLGSFVMVGVATPAQAQSIPPCVRSGCSGELCVRAGSGMNTSCVFQPEYACLQQASCEENANGMCAFTITPQVQACLDQANPSASPTASPSVSPSPSASPTPAVTPSPTVLIGDFNNDGRVNLLDHEILINSLFETGDSLQTDLNQDGKVNLLDYHILVLNLNP